MVNLAMGYLWKEETGFTLVEVLVSAMMMFGVLFALYAIFEDCALPRARVPTIVPLLSLSRTRRRSHSFG